MSNRVHIKNNNLKRSIAILLIIVLLVAMIPLSSCGQHTYNPLEGVETVSIQDDTGRTVEIPVEITRIAASGSTAQMILMTIAPDMLVGLSASPSTQQMPYFPENMWTLPTFGQFYGSKANLNMEALIDAKPQIVIDLGDRKLTGSADMASIQHQTGIPTVFFEATLETMPDAYRALGKILHREDKAEKLAQYIEQTIQMAEENRAQISEEERYSVMYGTGATGLACNAAGSSQADVIDIVGAKNAIVTDEITNRGGGTTVSLEEVYTVQPDVIVLAKGGPYDELESGEWSGLSAVQNGLYYEIPNLPYSWMSSPPSVNRVLGVYWLGNLLYPQYYDYDMVEKAQEFYSLFWHYDLSREEAEEMLANSTGKGIHP